MTNDGLTCTVADDAAMVQLGRRLATVLVQARLVALTGDLGAGKTTLVRGVLQGLGHQGSVKSPTFTLVEPYELNGYPVYHFDLFRLHDAEELEFLGVREYLQGGGLCLVEWPEKGTGFLPTPDVNVTIRKTDKGRSLQFELLTDRGAALADALMRILKENHGAQCV